MVLISENNIVQSAMAVQSTQESRGASDPRAIVGLSEFEQRINKLIARPSSTVKSPSCAEPDPEEPPTVETSGANAPSEMGMALIEMTQIAKEVARTDQMIDHINEGVPDSDEAKKWHNVSLQTLRFSRDLLRKRQHSCLAQLGSVVGLNAEPPEYKEDVQGQELELEAEVRACPEFQPKVNVATRAAQAKLEVTGGGSLRRDLEILRETHPERVLIVRRIKRLGFESPHLLKEHFLQYGGVSDVLVAHSHVKSTAQRPNSRVRPAALGFVVMESEIAAGCALAAGAEQAVGDTVIQLCAFTAIGSPRAES